LLPVISLLPAVVTLNVYLK